MQNVVKLPSGRVNSGCCVVIIMKCCDCDQSGSKHRFRVSLLQLLCAACFRFLSNKSAIAASSFLNDAVWRISCNKPRLTIAVYNGDNIKAAGVTIALYGSSQASDFFVIHQREPDIQPWERQNQINGWVAFKGVVELKHETNSF